MKRVVVLGAVLVGLLAATPAAASTICVPSAAAGCDSSTSNLQTALTEAESGGPNTVKIGPGAYENGTCSSGGFTGTYGTTTTVVGSGAGETILSCPADYNNSGHYYPIISLSGLVTVSNLTIVLPSGDGDRGLTLGNSALASDIALTTNDAATNATGVTLEGGTLEKSILTLDTTDQAALGINALPGSIDGVVVSTNGFAIGGGESGGNTSITHTTVIAAHGIDISAGTAAIYDSLIELTGNSFPGLEASSSNSGSGAINVTAGNLTIIGSASGAVGVASDATATGQQPSLTLTDSVIYGTTTPLQRESVSGSTANLTTAYDDYPAGSYAGTGPGTTTQNGAQLSANPDFIDPSTGNYQLAAGSPLIDAGAPGSLAPGEPSTDLAGNPRILAGNGSCVARRDIGAYEYVRPTLPASASASVKRTTTGRAVTFRATGCSIDPSLAASFTWKFDDGGTASGQSVTHAFRTPGVHHATVTVSDSAGRHGTATATVTVLLEPVLSQLKLGQHRGRATVTYRDNGSAITTLTVERMGKHGRLSKIEKLRHRDRAGRNTLSFSTRHLKPGHYLLVALARSSNGLVSRPVEIRFAVR